MGWEHYHTVDPLEKEPQVLRGLFGVRLLILHFKFQFSKSTKSSAFHIFLNFKKFLNSKKISVKKCPKITRKFKQNRKTLVKVLNGGIWCCLKRERDIGTKATLSGMKTAFSWNPALTCKVKKTKRKLRPHTYAVRTYFLQCNSLFSVWHIFSVAHFSTMWPFFSNVPNFQRVTYCYKCELIFTVWAIFHSVTHFSKCDPYFSVAYFSQMWSFVCVTHFYSVTHSLKFISYFSLMRPIFSTYCWFSESRHSK